MVRAFGAHSQKDDFRKRRVRDISVTTEAAGAVGFEIGTLWPNVIFFLRQFWLC
jgi:hypothetical protein